MCIFFMFVQVPSVNKNMLLMLNINLKMQCDVREPETASEFTRELQESSPPPPRFLNSLTWSTWTFPRQGLTPSYSCGTAGSFNPLHRARDRTDTSSTTLATAFGFLTHLPQQELPTGILLNLVISVHLIQMPLCTKESFGD